VETLSIVLSITSILVAVGATALAVMFYRWADLEAKQTSDNIRQVGSAIDRMNQIVEILRTESFNLVKSSQADLLTLAMQGMRRAAPDDDELVRPGSPSPRPVEDRDALRDSSAVVPGGHGEGDSQIVQASDALGRHMMKRRGADFANVLSGLQKRIMAEFEKVPKGTVLNPGELFKRLGDEEFDIAEIVYAVHTLDKTGQLRSA